MKAKDFKFSDHSKRELDTLHPDLATLCLWVIQWHDFKVNEGHRNKEDQDFAYLSGTSNIRWPDGKHNKNPSEAVDLLPFVNGRFIGWTGHEAERQWQAFGGFVMGVAAALRAFGQMEHHIRWGGDWDSDWNTMEHTFQDAPHFEIVRDDD